MGIKTMHWASKQCIGCQRNTLGIYRNALGIRAIRWESKQCIGHQRNVPGTENNSMGEGPTKTIQEDRFGSPRGPQV